MSCLITYDLADDRMRRRVATTLEGYGQRVQKSVFEVPTIEVAHFEELRARLRGEIDLDPEDSIRLYDLCGRCMRSVTVLGGGPEPMHDPRLIII